MIRRHQEIRIAQTGTEEQTFDIRKSPIFERARLACIASMRRSRRTPGVCKKRKKVDEIEGKFFGKSGRTTVISRMIRAGVPQSVGMRITGQRTLEAYHRYDKTVDLQAKCVMDVVTNPFDANGSRRTFDAVYKEELKRVDEIDRLAGGNASALIDSHSSITCDQKLNVDSSGIVDPKMTLNLVAPAAIGLENVVAPAIEVESDELVQFNRVVETLAATCPPVTHALGLQMQVSNISGGTF